MCFGTIICGNRVIKDTCPLTCVSLPECCCWGGNDGLLACSLQTPYGIVLSAGSDGPCTDPDPMLWVHKAVNHTDPKQALSVYEALRMCTFNGYYTTFDDAERGSLETGKIADMCVLSDNPYTVPRDALKDVQVEQLILSGKPYRDQPKGAVTAMLRGILGKKNC